MKRSTFTPSIDEVDEELKVEGCDCIHKIY